jgi:hypothetical protein
MTLHGKHVKGRTVMHARVSLLGAILPVLGTVLRIRAIPGKVANIPHLKHLTVARQRVESTTDRYGVPLIIGC